MSTDKKILVSHSGRQYVHQLLLALQLAKIDSQFLTSFWFKPNQLIYKVFGFLPLKIKAKVEKEFKKRSYEPLSVEHIKIFPWFEILREIGDKIIPYQMSEYLLFMRDRIHDKWVSKNISLHNDIVVGYEECSVLTFRKAKKLGKITVLDLAQIHNREITAISNKFPAFSSLYQNKKLRTAINNIKDEEMALADYILCLSTFAKDSLIKYGIVENKIRVVNLGFDPLKFTPKKIYNDKSKLKLVYAGTITKRKGIDLLLKLTEDIGDKIELTFIGPMADAESLFAQYKNKFNWHPYLEQQEMNKVFNESDVFVFPSYLDSWAMVVIEAMACGLPVVISENTGSKDAVSPDCGFVLETGNYLQLQNTILDLYNDRPLLETLGRSARLNALNFTWENYHQQIQRFFLSIA